jgi:subtilisin family serine protease
MAAIQANWTVARAAAAEYQRFALEIDRIKRNAKLFRKGLLDLENVVPDAGRVQARLGRETAHEAWLPGGPAKALFRAQERMLGTQLDLQEVGLLDQLVQLARAVGLVVLPGQLGKGTGWLIGENLLLTNHHVLPNAAVAQKSYLTMGFERNAGGQPQTGQTFALRPDLFYLTPRETATADEQVALDFTVVAVESLSQEGQPLRAYGYVPLDGGAGKAIESENCMVVQHPGGDYKKITLRDIRLLLVTDQPDADQHLFYESDTLAGSSGGLVIGLGTGQAIALHRASVPRLDAQGRVLRRDGQPWQPEDADNTIDWIANQGVRVSKLVEYIGQATVPAAMRERHGQLVAALHRTQATAPGATPPAPPVPAIPATPPLRAAEGPEPPILAPLPAPVIAPASGQTVDFLVRVSPVPLLRAHTVALLGQHWLGASIEELIPADVPSHLKTYLVVTIAAAADPWAVAAQLEALDGVEEAEPDLPRYQTASPTELAAARRAFRPWESSSGRSEWQEPQFLATWLAGSPWLAHLDPTRPDDLRQIRRWSQRAAGYDAQRVADLLGAEGLRALAGLQLAQLDTGYSDHSKVRAGYNLALDYDALDEDDDARDLLQRGFGDFPGHGTRTASLLVGTDQSQVVPAHEGNFGLLHALSAGGYTVRTRLAPFRVAKSVILLGSIKRVARAVQHALDHGFQVLTMSMGTLGNAIFDDLARTVYERGVIWTCAAGNQVRFVVAPAKYPGVICVAASNPFDAPWQGSCRGEAVDITAPGENVYVPILTEDGQEDMNYGDGTSFAAPHVAAAAMLWLAKNEPALGTQYPQAWQRVEAFRLSVQRSARRAPKLPAGQFGAGILNIEALLALPLPAPAELRHAYTGALGIEKTSVKTPLAARETAYQDWQQTLSAVLGQPQPQPVSAPAQELAGPAAPPLGPAARQFARALESYAGLSRLAGPLAAGPPPSPSLDAAYARLLALEQAQARPKPHYEPLPPAAGDAPLPTPATTT